MEENDAVPVPCKLFLGYTSSRSPGWSFRLGEPLLPLKDETEERIQKKREGSSHDIYDDPILQLYSVIAD